MPLPPAPSAVLGNTSIDDVIDVVATRRETPDAAMQACVARIGEALPALLDVLSRAGAHGLRRERDRVLLFRAVHILGAARATAACQPTLRVLRRPVDEVEAMLGDTLTETLPRIIASVFDGDAPALFAAIVDRRIDEAARWSLLTAAAFLTWDGKIDAAATHTFLHGFGTGRLAPRYDAAWIGWGEAVAVLGLADLAPLVETVWSAMPPEIADLRRFRETMADAVADPRDPGRFEASNAGYLDDVVTALDWTRPREDDDAREHSLAKPATNPLRGVGRNDPCPCGSGRKYKKCCAAGT